MDNLKRDEYDVIIIGAGIGGLACGCYLAKAGMKVLIIEKNSQPGGYCVSFKRNGFLFDACVHAFGSFRRGGQLHKIFNELKLEKRIQVRRYNPSDTILLPESKIKIHNDINLTLNELKEHFPKNRKQIESFFDFIIKLNLLVLQPKLKRVTFQMLLDSYFSERKLKSIFSILLGNVGLPSTLIGALPALLLYREFIFDGGYYPEGGMQAFSNSLTCAFKSFGGEIIFSNIAETIKVKNREVDGVMDSHGIFYKSKRIVADCDQNQIILKLSDGDYAKSISKAVSGSNPSCSAFLVYLGIRKDFKNRLDKSLGIWNMPTNYNIEKQYLSSYSDSVIWNNNFLFCSIPYLENYNLDNNISLRLIINCPFKNGKYWMENKERLMGNLINRLEKLYPGVSEYIMFKEAATPLTLHRYTLNLKGAMCGWAATPKQLNKADTYYSFNIKGLFFVGHWAIEKFGHCGISMVAVLGKKMANQIISRN